MLTKRGLNYETFAPHQDFRPAHRHSVDDISNGFGDLFKEFMSKKGIIKEGKLGRIVSPEYAAENPDTTMEFEEITLEKALKVLRRELKKDKELFFAWQSNIAMAFVDAEQSARAETGEHNVYKIANEAATNFLNLLISETVEAPEEVETVDVEIKQGE